MPIVLLILVIIAVGLFWRRATADSDLPARIVAAAADRLPAHRREWGQAMLAELTGVHGSVRRWQFAAGALRVVLFPPPRHRHRVLVVGMAALAAASLATFVTAREVPSLSTFVAEFGVLLCGLAVVVTARAHRARPSVPRVLITTIISTGAVAVAATIVRIGVAHPAATTDHAHVVSTLLAITLTGYVAIAISLTRPRPGDRANIALWWALGGSLASSATWVIAAITTPIMTAGVIAFLSPASAAATVLAAIGAAAATRDRHAGIRAGLLTAILSAPVHFTITMTAILRQQHFTLPTPYDVAAYPNSGYPDVASYLIGDILGGEIIAGLLLGPITLLAIAILGGAVGTALRHLAARVPQAFA
jgi:hypothetical protein